jgi:hypothetical protein
MVVANARQMIDQRELLAIDSLSDLMRNRIHMRGEAIEKSAVKLNMLRFIAG